MKLIRVEILEPLPAPQCYVIRQAIDEKGFVRVRVRFSRRFPVKPFPVQLYLKDGIANTTYVVYAMEPSDPVLADLLSMTNTELPSVSAVLRDLAARYRTIGRCSLSWALPSFTDYVASDVRYGLRMVSEPYSIVQWRSGDRNVVLAVGKSEGEVVLCYGVNEHDEVEGNLRELGTLLSNHGAMELRMLDDRRDWLSLARRVFECERAGINCQDLRAALL